MIYTSIPGLPWQLTVTFQRLTRWACTPAQYFILSTADWKFCTTLSFYTIELPKTMSSSPADNAKQLGNSVGIIQKHYDRASGEAIVENIKAPNAKKALFDTSKVRDIYKSNKLWY